MKCATEIFMDCKDSAEKAKKKAEQKDGKARDFKDAMGCWDNAVKSMEVLAKAGSDKEDQNKGASAIIAFVESERAKDAA